MIRLKNKYLTVTIQELGAEVISVIDNDTGYEFIWQGQKKKWNRHAPILFPIIGRLKDETYHFEEQTYQLNQHGFARDMMFNAQLVNDTTATFFMRHQPDTLQVYPFEFSLQVNYILSEKTLTVCYEVLNASAHQKMYYNIGGHPAFNVTFNENKEFDKVFLSIEPSGKYLRLPVNKVGLIEKHKARYHSATQVPIERKLFKKDTVIYQLNHQAYAILSDENAGVEITVKPVNFSYLAVWSPYPNRNAFVCLEPWAGLPDLAESNQDFEQKYGILKLEPKKIACHDYTITFNKQMN